MNSKESPRYRIQTVALRTGVPAATLRAWERRYGIPRPGRTGTAYRSYSERDVQLVQRLRELCESGLAPSDAATLLRQEAGSPGDETEATPPVVSESSDVHRDTVDRIIAAVRAMDIERLDQELVRTRGLGSSIQIFEKVLRPVLEAVGNLWHAGEISVAHEHLATEMINTTLRELLRLSQPTEGHRLALLACFADELHTGSLYGIAFRLIGWGCRIAILGGLTPPSAVGTAVRKLQPDVVGLSVTMEPSAARARELVEGYALACTGVPWVVGGRGAESLASVVQQFGGNLAPQSEAETHALFERLLVSSRRFQIPRQF
jgi:MerR family transcriptional regulator, light-induced transcriptional regulator